MQQSRRIPGWYPFSENPSLNWDHSYAMFDSVAFESPQTALSQVC